MPTITHLRTKRKSITLSYTLAKTRTFSIKGGLNKIKEDKGLTTEEKLFSCLRLIENYCLTSDCEDCAVYGHCKSLFSKNPCGFNIDEIEKDWRERNEANN
jgi:HEPN domain-containing protein